MNRLLQQFLYSGNKMFTAVNFIALVDGSGDPFPPASVPPGNLVSSIEHVSAGVYRVHLVGPLNAGLACLVTPLSSAIAPQSPSGVVCEPDPQTLANISDNDDPSFDILCFAAGVLTDPSPGCGFSGVMFGRNSSIAK